MSAMPHNVKIWVDDQPGLLTYYIDEKEITEVGAQVTEAAVNALIEHWHRSPNNVERPHLRLHTG
ncbi:hypothetical protein ACFYOY_13750 [Streptomyces sp. NPDC007875]|uniref:hypothetical protein n=1 Tax=Streptomyces sp. NPDC007875 TaxID=3364783 RepID=UPI0036787C76